MKKIYFLWSLFLFFVPLFFVSSSGGETITREPIADGTVHLTCADCAKSQVIHTGENCYNDGFGYYDLELDGYRMQGETHNFNPVIEFDISELSGQLANSASLKVEKASGSTASDIRVKMREGGGTLVAVSGFYAYPITDNASLGEEIDVTEMLNLGISKGYSVVGFVLIWNSYDRDGNSYCCIASSESSNPPILTIDYGPTVVEMSSFKATPSNKQVNLEWKTETEIDNAGFNVWRAEGFKKINERMLPGKGSMTMGSEYDFVDNFVLNRKDYFYLVEDVDIYGISTFHGPVKATPRLIHGIMK